MVLDNFSTHSEYALYEFLPPNKARRLLEKLEFHFTPPYRSWLNMTEVELRALASQCLDRRILDAATLHSEVAAWEQSRNDRNFSTDW